MVLVGLAVPLMADQVRATKSALLEVSGRIRLDAVFEDPDINDYVWGMRNEDSFVDPELELRMLFHVKMGVKAHLALRTPPYARDVLGGRAIFVTDTVSGQDRPYPTRIMEVSEAYLEARQFLHKNLSLSVGLLRLNYPLIPGSEHGTFLLAIGETEDPFAGTIYANWPTNKASASKPAAYSNRFSWNAPGQAGSVEAGGVRLSHTYKFGFGLAKQQKRFVETQFDFIAATTYETLYLNQDRDIVGVIGRFWYPFRKQPTLWGQMAILTYGINANSRIWTLGGGLAYRATKSFTLYGEAYGQTGDLYEGFTRPSNPNDPWYWLSSRDGTITQQAFAGYFGIRYEMKPTEKSGPFARWRPYFDISYWWISGDKNPHDRRNQDFLTYEDVDTTMILEEDRYGCDLDTNYEALKLIVGCKPHSKVRIYLVFANVRKARDYTAKDRIGREIDLVIKWQYTEDLSFKFGLANVWQADYMLEGLAGRRHPCIAVAQMVLNF